MKAESPAFRTAALAYELTGDFDVASENYEKAAKAEASYRAGACRDATIDVRLAYKKAKKRRRLSDIALISRKTSS